MRTEGLRPPRVPQLWFSAATLALYLELSAPRVRELIRTGAFGPPRDDAGHAVEAGTDYVIDHGGDLRVSGRGYDFYIGRHPYLPPADTVVARTAGEARRKIDARDSASTRADRAAIF